MFSLLLLVYFFCGAQYIKISIISFTVSIDSILSADAPVNISHSQRHHAVDLTSSLLIHICAKLAFPSLYQQ